MAKVAYFIGSVNYIGRQGWIMVAPSILCSCFTIAPRYEPPQQNRECSILKVTNKEGTNIIHSLWSRLWLKVLHIFTPAVLCLIKYVNESVINPHIICIVSLQSILYMYMCLYLLVQRSFINAFQMCITIMDLTMSCRFFYVDYF